MGEAGNVVAMAGATGFTGRRVARLLASQGARLRCLVRPTSDGAALPPGAEVTVGDLADGASVRAWLCGARSVVYCASMGFGHVADIVAAAREGGVRRALFVSTTGIFTRLPAPSRAVRVAAEDSVRSGLPAWTIVRPTMIYGAPGDRNMERLLRRVATRRFVLVPGRGEHLIQPVHVDDLAAGIVAAWREPLAAGNAYALSGAAPLTLSAVIDAAAHAVGRHVRRIHAPLRPVAWTLGLTERLGVPLPIKREQVLRLAEDKAFEHDAAARDFGFRPRSFAVGIEEEARALGLVGGGAIPRCGEAGP